MIADVKFYGIRHHGPGSTRQLLAALEDFAPTHVLIEAPADTIDWLATLADANVKPPIALLGYVEAAPRFSAFWPFEVYSPEYQGALWAVRNLAELRAIDLPAAITLGAVQLTQERLEQQAAEAEQQAAEAEQPEDSEHQQYDDIRESVGGKRALSQPNAGVQSAELNDDFGLLSGSINLARKARLDPIGTLAHLGGYEDGEDWWAMVIEDNPNPGDIFAAIEDAMTALRELADSETLNPDDCSALELVPVSPKSEEHRDREAMREAYMRLEIAKAIKDAGPDGRVAVVCGAWHVPALISKSKTVEDRKLLKGVWKAKVAFSMVPWSASRMTRTSGYGAGVRLPLWNRTIWEVDATEMPSHWLGRVASQLRDQGELVSTAAVIDANRTSRALAQLRGRPMPGLGEYREAGVSAMCFGEGVKWDLAIAEMVKVDQLGEIPDSLERPPILRDLELRQKKTRLKPETLARNLAIDLRSDSGTRRSALLHQLRILDVHWGLEQGRGGSPGTFRENWTVEWKPGLEVDLLDKLHYGSTIETAASALLAEQIAKENQASSVAQVAMNALSAFLSPLIATAMLRVELLSARSIDALDLCQTVERLVWLVKMGQARKADLSALPALIARLVVRLCLNLPGEVRSLDDDAAHQFSAYLDKVNGIMTLIDWDDQLVQRWQAMIHQLAFDDAVNPRVAGLCLRLVRGQDGAALDAVMTTLNRRLSAVFLAEERAGFFGGFFEGQGAMLMFDAELRQAMQDWFMLMDAEDFEARLPLLRRAFSDLVPLERQHLLHSILHGQAVSAAGGWTTANIPNWAQMQDQILVLMGARV